jgi:hypothetical protein
MTVLQSVVGRQGSFPTASGPAATGSKKTSCNEFNGGYEPGTIEWE